MLLRLFFCWVFLSLGIARLLADPPQAEFVLAWGNAGDQPGQFHSPIGIALNSREEVFITDLNNARVQKFSNEGTFQSEFALPLDAPERQSAIIGGIAIDEHDLIYLSFMVQHKIAVYRETGELVREWGSQGNGQCEFNQPGGLLLTGEGEILICDQCNHRIQRHTTEGEYVSEWGGWGLDHGQFDGIGENGSRFGGPHFIARDSIGRLYTTEGFQGRVQRFMADGQWQSQWGDKGDQPGGFGDYQFGSLPIGVGPIGIAIDPQDRVYVSSLNDRVQIFDTEGDYFLGITGTGEEGDSLLHPHGMAFDQAGHLYICDAGNQRILKFAITD